MSKGSEKKEPTLKEIHQRLEAQGMRPLDYKGMSYQQRKIKAGYGQ